MNKNDFLKNEYINYCNYYKSTLDCYNDKTILVAGASGLIGSHLIKLICAYNNIFNGTIHLIAMGRNKAKMQDIIKDNSVNFVESDYKNIIDVKCDYVINCASNTSSESFIHNPSGTILDNINIMKCTLDIAKNNNATYIYTSSQEVYGHPSDTQKIFSENDLGFLATDDLRNSYPETKRISEILSFSYAKQYNINVYIGRLAKCYAVDSNINDKRVVADFTRKAIKGQSIILKTAGKMQSTFGYILDVVAGLLYLPANKCEPGIYNIGSDNSDYSIYELAKLIAIKGNVDVIIQQEDFNKTGYSKVSHMLQDLSKIKAKGFLSHTSLTEGIDKIFQFNNL